MMYLTRQTLEMFVLRRRVEDVEKFWTSSHP